MKKYGKMIVGIAVMVVILLASSILYKKLSVHYGEPNQSITEETETGKEANTESKGTKIADFTVVDLKGNEVKLSSLVGKPIVLNFWASWCSPCKSEMPEFQKAYEEYGEQVTFVMVNLTDGMRETKNTAGAFINKEGYTFPVYYDVNQSAAYAYSVSSIPTTYFIDKDGFVIANTRGAINKNTLTQKIDAILK